MAIAPILNNIRIIPRDEEFLNRKLGTRGEIFYDRDSNSLRLYDGRIAGGISLAKADLTNIPNAVFLAKATAAGVGSVGNNSESGASISVSATAPEDAASGNLWFNSINGNLYVYVDDGSSEQWVQPGLPIATLAPVAFTGDYDDLVNVPEIAEVDLTGLATEDYVDQAVSTVSVDLTGLATEDYVDTGISSLSFNLNSLTDVDTVSSPPTTGQVLKWTGTVWAPGVDVAAGGTGVDAETLSGFAGSYYLNYNNFTNRPDLTLLAPLNNPGFTGTVTGISATMVGLGNVTNESKATMFSSPAFTGTVTGISATMVGLGNVTNESKATMFSSPAFTGTVTGISATMVGLGNVTNESKATMFSSPAFTGTTTLQQSTEILNTKSTATGVVVHDFSTGVIWYHSSISANFTANFTNVPTTNDRTISIALILSQGATPYIPNAVQINGSAVTINWTGGSAPTGNANKIDVVNFTLIRESSAWTVISSLSSFG